MSKYKLDTEAKDLLYLECWRHKYKIPKAKPEGFIVSEAF